MGTVLAESQTGTALPEMSMSLAGPDDRVEALHGWYLNGEVRTRPRWKDPRSAPRRRAPRSCVTRWQTSGRSSRMFGEAGTGRIRRRG